MRNFEDTFEYEGPVRNFGILAGRAKVEDGTITVQETILLENGTSNISSPNQEVDYCIVRADINFNSGILQFSVTPKEGYWDCVLDLKTPNGVMEIGVPALQGSFSIPDGTSYKYVGSPKNYEPNQRIHFSIEILGSNIKLYINGILLGEGSCVVLDSPLTFRLTGRGLVLSDVFCTSQRPLAFTVMQFSTEYNTLYNDVIKPICEAFELECIRGDEFYESTPIIDDITQSIKKSTLIIAEITPDNPNVFYEIGYAHALNKPTILLCDKRREKLPFDMSGFRTLYYENSIGGKKKVVADLIKYLKAIFKRNPIDAEELKKFL